MSGILAIVIAALVLSILGLLFGAGLGVADHFLKVPTNPKVAELREVLPGANCGACGYPGCDGYASAVGLFYSAVGFLFVVTSNRLSRKATGSSLW